MANGIAREGAPSARLAIYKACWFGSCSDADLISAFDDAISDGVDILSVSIGGTPLVSYLDTMSIGTFHAFNKGIVVSASVGNSFPLRRSATNVAPWILTVAASTVDRELQSNIYSGNSKAIKVYSQEPDQF